ncbi:MAG: alkaline phosphatase family protein [Spirochaetaceae bacterium]|nr:alkaline phosphatase family protein [Spirochaetaceae bacterium]
MNEPCFPDYENSILNFSCSILNHYGVKVKHPTLPLADKLLEGNFKHVVVLLLDGLGVNILQKHLAPDAFLRQNLLCEYSSVFPPTTTASTTTMLSGLSPIEHGWLGWDVFFEQEDKSVTCFTNNLTGTETPAASYNVVRKYFPFKNIALQISETGRADAGIIFPFGEKPFAKLDDWFGEIKRRCSSGGRTFTYAYWGQPDSYMHKNGTDAAVVHRCVSGLNRRVEALCKSLKDTLVFVTADHGHNDITRDYYVENYPDFAKMLVRRPVIEPRAASFYVKDEYKAVFADEFNRLFGNDYMLFTKQQVFERQLFGSGEPHKNLTGIGDFVAAATGTRTMFWNKDAKPFKSHHAGIRRDEMIIPLIAYKC